MKWTPFTIYEQTQILPAERRPVLVQIDQDERRGMPAAVAVGYLRQTSDGPAFIVPGFGRSFVVTAWCDCLPADFSAPLWKVPMPARQQYQGIF